MHLEVPRQNIEIEDSGDTPRESCATVRERVEVCQARQQVRQACVNANLDAGAARARCVLTPDARQLLAQACERLALSARSYHKVLKVARTIADLTATDPIGSEHVAEVLSFRVLDRARRS